MEPVKSKHSLFLCFCVFIFIIGLCLSAKAQNAEKLMEGLGFRKSTEQYLYPLSLFRYSCNGIAYRPYLRVKKSSLAPYNNLSDKAIIHLLERDSIRYDVILPVNRQANTTQPMISVYGSDFVFIDPLHLLEPCSPLTTQSKLSLAGTTQIRKVYEEASDTWEDIISWYLSKE